MTATRPIAGAAEFPNDNPELHEGARWVCLAARGPARALLRAPATGSLELVPPGRARPGSPPPDAVAPAPLPCPFREVPREPPPVPPPAQRRCDGPLELDLGRIVLLHRVADVPPPPEFVYRPFVSSRARAAPVEARPIDPLPCLVVDERETRRRVARSFSVDVAPCLSVGSALDLARRQSRRRRPARTAAAREESALELAAASA